MPDAPRLPAGSTAPDFTVPDSDGAPVRLRDLRGQKVILFAYPAAGTPGCTTEATDFRDRVAQLDAAGYRIVGISPDPPEKLRRFREEHQLPFPLLSDPDHRVLEAYGAWGEKVLYGRRSTGVIRSTFVLDEQGRVAAAYYGVKAKGHAERVLRELGVARAF